MQILLPSIVESQNQGQRKHIPKAWLRTGTYRPDRPDFWNIYIYIYHIYASSHAVSTHRRLSQEAELIPHSPANTLIDQNTSSHAHKTHYTCRFRTSRYTSLQRCENSRYTWDTEEQQYELRWVQVRKGRKEEGGLGRTSQHKNNTTSKES